MADQMSSLNIALCDWGLASFDDRHLTQMITPDTLRAPEVLINAPWSNKTELWTLGTMIVDLVTGREAFFALDSHGIYNTTQHLHEITMNFGPFPPSLLSGANINWKEFVKCTFDWEGEVWCRPNLDSNIPAFEDWFTTFDDDEEKRKFIQMMRKMMQVDPDKRSSAEDLLNEAWLQDDGNDVHAHTLPRGEEATTPSHVSASPARQATPTQSDLPAPPPSSPVDSLMESETKNGPVHSSAPIDSSERNLVEPVVNSHTTQPSSPRNISPNTRFETKQDSLWQMQELESDQERNEKELQLLTKQHQTILGEENQKSQELQTVVVEKDEKIVELLHRSEGPGKLFEDAIAKQMQGLKQQMQQEHVEKSQQAEIQLLKHQVERLQAENSQQSQMWLLTQKVGRIETHLDRVIEKTSNVQDGLKVEKEEEVVAIEDASRLRKSETTKGDMGEQIPLPPKVETGPSNANAAIARAKAVAEASTLKLGLVLLGGALLVACPKECLLAAGIGAAACSLFKVGRSS